MNPITPARRVGQIEEYYLQRKMKQVAALNARGCDIVSLGVGGPDLMPPAAAIDTLCEAARRPDVHSYSVTTGIPALRPASTASPSIPTRRFSPLSAQRKQSCTSP